MLFVHILVFVIPISLYIYSVCSVLASFYTIYFLWELAAVFRLFDRNARFGLFLVLLSLVSMHMFVSGYYQAM
jgi:hypothetical protein